MPWSQTTYSFSVVTSTVPISGANADLSGTAPFLRFTDTDVGHEDWRIFVDADQFELEWLSSTGPDVWTDVLVFSDPAAATRTLTLIDYALFFTGLDAAQVFLRAIVSAEANPRFRVDTNGKEEWGPGGASAVDTALERIAAGVLQTATLRLTAAPSDANDAARKTYVDTADALKLNLSGGTMTGFITLHANPTAAMHAATKQYVDSAAGFVQKTGDTMTGTLTFDFAVSGTIIQSKVASEANPRWRVSSAGVMEWGPGGATAPDTGMEREAASILRMSAGDQFAVNPGSAAAPGLVFVGDPNTGIFSSGADILDFSLGGVVRIRIDGAGNLFTPSDAVSQLGGGSNRWTQLHLSSFAAIGGNPATTGAIRLQSAANIYGRNAANSANFHVIGPQSDDTVLISADGNDIKWGVALVALGGGAAPTLGTIGGSGPATAVQNSWMRVKDSTGAAFWVPAWK